MFVDEEEKEMVAKLIVQNMKSEKKPRTAIGVGYTPEEFAESSHNPVL